MARPSPIPTSTMRDSIKEDFEMLLKDENADCFMPSRTEYHTRGGDPTIGDTGGITYSETVYSLNGIITAYKPTENDMLESKVVLGSKTFHYAVALPTDSPLIGLPVEPRTGDFIMFNGVKYEVFGYDITSDEVEYKVHAQKVDAD